MTKPSKRSAHSSGGAARRRRGGPDAESEAASLPSNEVDDFMEGREEIRLTERTARRPRRDQEDDDDRRDFANLYGDDDDHTVLELRRGNGRGRTAPLDEEDDEEDEGVAQARRMIEEEQEDRERSRRSSAIRDEETMSKRWGTKKGAFYVHGSDSEHDEEDDAMEEQEVLRLQRERANELDDADFDDAQMLGAVLKRNRSDGTPSAKAATKTARGGRGAAAAAAAAHAGEKGKDEEKDDDEEEEVGEEKVARDLSNLSRNDKLQMVIADSPELLELVESLQKMLVELRQHLGPLLRRIKDQELRTTEGISFLEIKYHVMLNYCVNIVFYLYLKSEGRQVRDHPVIRRLVYYRTVMEKIRPLDQKLKYQVDKLLQVTAAGAAGAQGRSEDGGATVNLAATARDPLSFRPNPSALVARGAAGSAGGGAGGDDDDDDDVAGKDDEGEADEDDGDEEDGDVYKIPRTTPVAYVDPKERRRQRSEKKRLERLAGSSVMQDLRADLSEAPVERGASGLDEPRTDRRASEIRAFEEENFMRLMENRKSRKRREAGLLQSGDLDDLADFGDLERLVVDRPSGSRGGRAGRGGGQDGDDDEYGLDALAEANAAAAFAAAERGKKRKSAGGGKSPRGAGLDLDEDAYEDAAGLYDQLAGSRKKARQERVEAYVPPKPDRGAVLKRADPFELDEDAEGHRAASRAILKNRGLTASRPKGSRNSHVRMRAKYEDALKKRRSQVRDYKESTPIYGGETTGIKSRLVRSTSLKN